MQTDPFIDSVSLSDYYYNQVRAGLSHILLYCIYLIMYILYYAMLYRHMQVHNIHVIYILNYTNQNQPMGLAECNSTAETAETPIHYAAVIQPRYNENNSH